ncbi:MAG: outer membrane beta-barrel protein, partial [Bacteroidota bacterium]
FVFFSQQTYSQTSSINSDVLRFRAGVFADFGLNQYSTNFRKLPGIPNCCLNFRGGFGTGFSTGLLAEVPFSEKFLFTVRGGYSSLNGLLKEHDYTKVLVNDILRDGEFEHTIDAKISEINLDLLIGSRIWNNLFLYAGYHTGLLMQKEFEQKETITKPTDAGVFDDTHTRTRNDTSGTIPDYNPLNHYLKIGLSYELPMNQDKTLIAALESFYTYGLTDVVKGLFWRINVFNIGIALKYTFAPKEKVYEDRKEKLIIDTLKIFSETESKQKPASGIPAFVERKENLQNDTNFVSEIYKRTDTLFIYEKPTLSAKLKTEALYKNGERKEVMDIRIQQQFVTQAFTVLPIVFFDKGESDLPDRYKRLSDTTNFNIMKLEANPLVYNQTNLNIIGKRLVENPDAVITIQGFADPVTEEGNCELADSRANAVQKYLSEAWFIPADRLKIIKSLKNCIPEIITQTQNEYGFADNRHVFISADNPNILAPIIKTRFLETIDLPVQSFLHHVEAKPKKLVSTWNLIEIQNGETLYSESGKEIPDIIKQNINERFANSIDPATPVNTVFSVKSPSGETAQANYKITVQKDTSEFEIQRLSLAIFKVARFALRDIDKKAIQNFIKDLRPGDTISVVGYTDLLGNQDENISLSESRAKTVCEYIRQLPEYLNHKAIIIPCEGVWFTKKPPQIESYELPEERFLSRIVQIEIRRRWR